MFHYTSQTWLRADLENILNALVKAQARKKSRDRVTDQAYQDGFTDALEAVATALNIELRIGRR